MKKIFLLPLFIMIVCVFFVFQRKDFRENFSCNSININEILDRLKDINENIIQFNVVEKDVPGIPSEGTNIKSFYDKKDNSLVLVEVSSFASIARYFTKYYVQNGGEGDV